jgi:hypothetical protein
MNSAELILTFYPRSTTKLRDAERILTVLTKMVERGYMVRHSSQEQENAWSQEGISSAAKEAIQRFVDQQSDHVVVEFWGEIQGVFGIDSQQPSIYLMTEDHPFVEGEAGVQRYEKWLDLAVVVFNAWHPWYGYQSSPNGDEPATTREAAFQGKLACLYDINLFGPELVAQIGPQRIQTSHAWRKIHLDEDGVLVAPTPYAHEDGSSTRQQVANDLGLPYHLPSYSK